MSGRSAGLWIGLALSLGPVGCIEHRIRTEPIEVEPIHVTVDINYRVDRRLEEFFEFQQERRAPAPEGGAERERDEQRPGDGRRMEGWPPVSPDDGRGDAVE